MKPSHLILSDELALPPEAVTETFAFLAARRAGKTNGARVMAEEMFREHLPFVAVDPVGSWFGLRSSRDGKAPGLPIPIFGGRHGDVPLEQTGGTLIADLIVDANLSCVLDVSQFESEGAKKRFLLDFARRLYQRNETPRHLFLEEADDYIPQAPQRDEAQLLRAWENIVRRGGQRGLGCTVLTQRSASINKHVLTQVGTLIALRTTGPQDRDAVGLWLKHNAQSNEILASLASLKDGEAWVWSPHFLGVTQRFRFRLSTTFDSGATPKIGTTRRVTTLADVDLGAVTQQMAATIERAKASDPKMLQAEVAMLRRQIAARLAPAPPPPRAPRVDRATERAIARARKASLRAARKLRVALERARPVLATWDAKVLEARTRMDKLGLLIASIEAHVASADARAATPSGTVFTDPQAGPQPGRTVVRLAAPPPRAPAPKADGQALTRPQQDILDACAWWAAAGRAPVARPAVALLAGKSPRSSGFDNNLSALRVGGWIDYPDGGRVGLTPQGAAAARSPVSALTREVVEAKVREVCSRPQADIVLACLAINLAASYAREDLAKVVGKSPASSGFDNNLSALHAAGLLEYPARGYVAAAAALRV